MNRCLMLLTTALLALIGLLTLPAPAQNPLTQERVYAGEPSAAEDFFGYGLTTGDFDSNGSDEILIGSFGWNNDTGKNYLYPGGPTFPTAPGWTIQGVREHQSYDFTDKNIGDVNGDGIDDFCIAATIEGAPVQSDTAKLVIYFGGSSLDTLPDWVFITPYWGSCNIFDVDSCGDVNGDGGKDFVVVDIGVDYDQGKAFIFFGGSQLDTLPDWTIVASPYGTYCKGLGDVNGDGLGDVMIYQYGGPVKIYFGSSPMDTIPDLVFEEGELLTDAATGARDFNGDGYNDLVMCWHYPGPPPYGGPAIDQVYFGGVEMDTTPDLVLQTWFGDTSLSWHLSCGDFNGDGLGDIISTSGYGGFAAMVQIFLGSTNPTPQADAYLLGDPLEWGEQLDAGDINGDGKDELLITDIEYIFHYGHVYLYSGPETWVDYGVGGVSPQELQRQPGWFVLEQNHPNPFNSSTSIHFELGKPSNVNLIVYDLQGRKVKTLIENQNMSLGGYNVSWTGRDENNRSAASGMYLLKLQVDQYQEFKKMVLLR